MKESQESDLLFLESNYCEKATLLSEDNDTTALSTSEVQVSTYSCKTSVPLLDVELSSPARESLLVVLPSAGC